LNSKLKPGENVPAITHLCDRHTLNISRSQPGFLNFVVIPLLNHIVTIAPSLENLRAAAISNKEYWEKHKESAKEKLIYKNITKAKLDMKQKLWKL
jgi:hypothetical protein